MAHQIHSFFLSSLLPLLAMVSFSLLRLPPASDPTPTETPISLLITGNETLTMNYIVRFRDYRMTDDHHAYLEENLRFSEGWRWIERRNPALSFPTDFGVLEIGGERRLLLIEDIQRLKRVKDVFADTRYSRSLFFDGRGKQGFVSEKKRPGKIFTSMSFEEEGKKSSDLVGNNSFRLERKLMMEERTNWTNEDTLNDNLGHGTFVAGVIAGEDEECLGFAPDTEIYAFRVFTDAQVSYTSWFLDAFNYAIATNMDVLNLSIGGPDYLDLPFVEKEHRQNVSIKVQSFSFPFDVHGYVASPVWELTANNIIMVSAIGNDGPLYGTLNNPADQSDVIGVGGIDYSDHIASFSSRGMSTWEIPHGYGRVKPDVVAYGRDIMGSKITTGCKSLSGTSVASPVVAGAVCLLVSVIPENARKDLLNPASMKQALVEAATKLSGPNIYEQGAGKLNLLGSYEILKEYKPRATLFPSVLDYEDCPYMWPFCRQPLYVGAMPVIFNATILNGMGVIGFVESPPTWHPFDDVSNLLSIRFTYSDVIWPWTGFLALHMQIKEEGSQFSGFIEGNVIVKVYSPPHRGEKDRRISTCSLRLKLRVAPTPPRSRRVLWDQYHNIKYPPGYIPRDSLDVRNDILDWHGDHLHTNFHIMFNMLRDNGYFVEILGSPFTCFDASHYGTLLMVDLEDEYFREEIEKLRDDIVDGGLGLAVFSEWYNVDSMVKMRFFDDNTRSWWTPVTGGANIPALNELLAPLGIAFGDKILNGDFSINGEQSHYASGTDIVKFPGGGYVHSFELQDNSETRGKQNSGMTKESSILGLAEIGAGRVVVYGDSSCLDSSHMVANCYWLLDKIIDFTNRNVKDSVLFSDSSRISFPMHENESRLPSRRTDVNFSIYSKVVGRELMCYQDSRFEVWGTKGYGVQLMGRNRKLPGYPTLTLDGDFNITKKRTESNKYQASKSEENSSGSIVRNSFSKSIDFFGLLNHEEVRIIRIALLAQSRSTQLCLSSDGIAQLSLASALVCEKARSVSVSLPDVTRKNSSTKVSSAIP
ncbi:membrane-bound transcription factor site-1 protease [Dendrobium catenatum]|uniref:Membrane-bound transcription factor site-1 protease n=1 Tax=Dendrobium catenatum TaxID=906689 RepID=A0A2I0WKZ2_9ASPA|nr:membrane-bound transcription factor site-1 protease [Dendrobium catenatum]